VVDADALNLLAREPVKLPAGWIITPHPGEAARLLGSDAARVQADRLGACASCIRATAPSRCSRARHAGRRRRRRAVTHICERGNPGMATAGMGDVLTGVIAGLARSSATARRRARRRAGARAGGRLRRAGRAARPDRERRHRGAARLGESVTLDQRVWITPAARRPRRSRPRCSAAPARGAPCRIVTLSGDLGAGKSTFARGALRALGVHGRHQEPELHAARDYPLAAVTVVHLDLYRLKDPRARVPGSRGLPPPGHLWLVEWPEHGGEPRPARRPGVRVLDRPDGHRIERIEKFRPDK
jgi:tRNA threonylcarbamoyl adenosine modification protein YjeE